MLAVPNGAIAEEGITLVGQGALACARFNDDYAADPALAEDIFFAWAQGYLVGLNSRSDLFYDLKPEALDSEGQILILVEFCERSPRRDFIEAVRVLYQKIIVENIAQDQ